MNIVLNNPLETEAIAKIIGQKAQAGDVIVLTGDLGAGKTTMTKGIALGLGISQMIKSPTYTTSGRLSENIHKDDFRYTIWMSIVLKRVRMN